MITDDDKAQEELKALEESYWAEWRRVVVGNAEFQRDLRKLRRGYGLPLDFQNERRHALAWWDEQAKAGLPLQDELQALAERYGLWKRWGRDLLTYTVYGGVTSFLAASLEGSVYIAGGQGRERRIVIGERANIRNPIVQEHITALQSSTDDQPPRPGPSSDGARVFDWRPLREWKQRHPEMTVTELAAVLGYKRSYLSRKLSEVGNEGK